MGTVKYDFNRMAVEFARRCGAKKLVLNHFSQRYRSEKDEKYNLEESITDQILLKQGELFQTNNIRIYNVFSYTMRAGTWRE